MKRTVWRQDHELTGYPRDQKLDYTSHMLLEAHFLYSGQFDKNNDRLFIKGAGQSAVESISGRRRPLQFAQVAKANALVIEDLSTQQALLHRIFENK